VNNLSLGPRSFDVFRPRAMAFFTSNIELHIFGFISPIHFFQFEPCVMATRTAHIKRFLHGRLFESSVLVVPILEIIGNPTGSGLVPLDWENVITISNLNLIPLFPTPSPESPRYVVSDLLGKVFCIH
jgi:hypothetical protein